MRSDDAQIQGELSGLFLQAVFAGAELQGRF
jgi:hypothetical protein